MSDEYSEIIDQNSVLYLMDRVIQIRKELLLIKAIMAPLILTSGLFILDKLW